MAFGLQRLLITVVIYPNPYITATVAVAVVSTRTGCLAGAPIFLKVAWAAAVHLE